MRVCALCSCLQTLAPQRPLQTLLHTVRHALRRTDSNKESRLLGSIDLSCDTIAILLPLASDLAPPLLLRHLLHYANLCNQSASHTKQAQRFRIFVGMQNDIAAYKLEIEGHNGRKDRKRNVCAGLLAAPRTRTSKCAAPSVFEKASRTEQKHHEHQKDQQERR